VNGVTVGQSTGSSARRQVNAKGYSGKFMRGGGLSSALALSKQAINR
jgi:hypothetical protein